MATYYVSADSVSTNWANAQTIGTPCTVATAMTNAAAGDVVRFLSGTYEPPNASDYETPSWNPSNNGTAGNPITFMSHVRHGAIINDCANAAATGFSGFGVGGAGGRDYITFDGFSCVRDKDLGTLASSHTVIAGGSSNIIIKNCDYTGRSHFNHTNGCCIACHTGSSIYIHNNLFHGQTSDPNRTEDTINVSAVYLFSTTDFYVYNNTIYDCHNGISWKTAPNNVNCYQNFLYDLTRAAFFPTLETTGQSNWNIHHNLVLNAAYLVDMEDSPATTATGMKIYNNTVYDSGAMTRGVFHGQDGGNQPWRSTEFYNNIFHLGASTRILEIYDNVVGTTAFPTVLDYNCYYMAAGTASWSRNATTNTTIAGWRTTAQAVLANAENNSITTTPSFVNAGGTAATDYQLNGGGCVGTGSGGVDMGAWQGVSTMGYQSESSSGTLAFFLR
ncbi:MAG: hypothetical protein ABT940_00450 [Alphaproteobacteria bacterium]